MATPHHDTSQFDVPGTWGLWMCPKGSTQATFFVATFNDDKTFSAGAHTTPFSGTWSWDGNPFDPFTIAVTEGNPVDLQPPFTMDGFLVAGERGGAMGGGIGANPASPDAVWSAAKVPVSAE